MDLSFPMPGDQEDGFEFYLGFAGKPDLFNYNPNPWLEDTWGFHTIEPGPIKIALPE
jgi:hypothetical protein